MLHRWLAVAALAAALSAQADLPEDYRSFRASIERSLREHPFFSRVSFTLVDKPPFLFCVERPANDARDWELGVVNGYLPFLKELLAQWEEHYRRPAELVRRPEAGGYALAVLSSAGRYVDFRTAVGDPSLAMMRAHYTPSLRLAVTYQDTFARHNTKGEERHALLHEFVHALQHAHAADGRMPKPVWCNEGLADYRASSTNLAASLREPPLQANHVAALAFGYANPAGRFFVAPLTDLVAANSYQEVLELAQRRNGAALPADTVLSMFYAQAEMFVRFLHEGEQGRYRAGFGRYVQAVQRSEAGVTVFERAFDVAGAEAMARLDAEWLRWLDATLRREYPTMRDLTKGAAAAAGTVPLAPPVPFDAAGFAWAAADLDDRLAGARRLCAAGDYEAALQLLPADADAPAERHAFLQRERARIDGLIALRDAALADLVQKKGSLSVVVGDAVVKGRVVRIDGGAIVVQAGRAETVVPLAAMTPAVLLGEGRRLKRFEGPERWLEAWTRWLKGDPLKQLQGTLQLDYPTLKALRQDLAGDCDPQYGAPAAALLELARLPQVDDQAGAAASLQRLRELLRRHGRTPLFERRKASIDKLARAFAERAFRLDDPEALGLRGAATRADDGTVHVEYVAGSPSPDADFTLLAGKELEGLPPQAARIAWSGQSGLAATADGWQLVGSAWLRWAVGLSGRQAVEIEFAIRADFVPDFGVAMCAGEGRMMLVHPTGGVQVFDVEQQVFDAIGGGATLMVDQTHKLRIEHDGRKSMQVSLDGKPTARVQDVGRMTAGDLLLWVHASTPVAIRRIAVDGVPDPADPQRLRDRYVQSVLATLRR